MSLYEKNLKAFSARHDKAARFIDGLDTANYRVVASASGRPALQFLIAPGQWEFCDHPEDPAAEARALVGDFPRSECFILVMGMGLGDLLFETLKRYPKSRVLVLEHDGRIFRKALETHDFTEIFANPNVSFVVASRADHLSAAFLQIFHDNDNDLYLPALELVKNDRILKFSKSYYPEAGRIFKQAVNYYWEIYVGNNTHDALKGLRHVLSNLDHLGRMMCLTPYLDAFRGRPGIVVSSGPSLGDKLDDLRRLQDRALIVCADSALKTLLANGIVPFGVSCVERDDINAELFQGFSIPESVILFAPPLIKPVTIETYPGPICTFFRSSYPFKGLPELLPLWHYGLSCSHLSYQVLNYLGCDEIALLGQDLAYDRQSGSSHFAGAIAEAHAQYAAQERVFVTGNDGHPIASSRDWVTFRDFYEEIISHNAGRHRVLNVIEERRGARIPGTTRVDAQDYFRELAEKAPVGRFDKGPGEEWIRERAPAYLSELAGHRAEAHAALGELERDFERIKASADFVTYLRAKKAGLARLNDRTRFLFEDLLKPVLKVFEANAASVWSTEEFLRHLGPTVDRVQAVVAELREVLCP